MADDKQWSCLASLCAIAVVVVTAPEWMWTLKHWDDPTVPAPQGTVQTIRYIGNIGIDSQVDTEQRSFMVRGVTHLHKGSRVELRKTLMSLQLCNADTGACEELMGYR